MSVQDEQKQEKPKIFDSGQRGAVRGNNKSVARRRTALARATLFSNQQESDDLTFS